MTLYLENILLLDHQPRTASNCAQVLELLGCKYLTYRDYSDPENVEWADEDIDIVIAAWTDREVERRTLLMALMGCTKLPKVRGVMVVSPFSTPANAKLLQLCGARAWIRYDRRREPPFPISVPVWKRGQLALPA
jgi:hypothetical protein